MRTFSISPKPPPNVFSFAAVAWRREDFHDENRWLFAGLGE
jgi:hypothetical protein